MARIYEGMFLLDNEVVRAGWREAKALVTDVLTKNGAEVQAARRWDERKLAYPIRRRRRGTYLLVYYGIAAEHIPHLVRDLDLCEGLMRYLLTGADDVPATEIELAAAENAEGFTVPAPPADDAGTEEIVRSEEVLEEPEVVPFEDESGERSARSRRSRAPVAAVAVAEDLGDAEEGDE